MKLKHTVSMVAVGVGLASQAFAQDVGPVVPPTATNPNGMPGVPAGGDGAEKQMGEVGHFVVSADLNVSLSWSNISPPMGNSNSSTDITIAPSADYFVIPNISVGGNVVLGHGSSSQPNGTGGTTDVSTTTLGLGVRGGYHMPIAPKISFWPRLGLSYNHVGFSSGGSDSSQSAFTIFVYAPILFHPAPHFFVGIGPSISQDLTSSVSSGSMSADGDKTLRLALESTVGGWF